MMRRKKDLKKKKKKRRKFCEFFYQRLNVVHSQQAEGIIEKMFYMIYNITFM